MFESLTERLGRALKMVRGGGRITEAELEAALREIRLALLEADVSFKVVKTFLGKVRERALGKEVLESLTPGQQVVGVVRDELVELLGGQDVPPMNYASKPPTVWMLVGLQGSGKTTTTAKLGKWLAGQGRHPLIAPVDLQRPAAVLQAIQMAKKAEVAAYEHDGSGTPVQRAREALDFARSKGFDVVLLDTAGRLHIDDELMDELRQVRDQLEPVETLYVADAMTGQDAVRSAESFHERIGVSGVVLSKLDGDARGGAALSVRAVTGVPIRFATTGEKVDAIEAFDPGRMAQRILGMGDVLGLIEKAEQAFDVDEAKKLEKSIRKQKFTLENFRDTLKQIKKMGPLDQLMGMIPGVKLKPGAEVDTSQFVKMQAMIDSMTARERNDHRIINGSRRKRIARGSGCTVQDVNRLIKQFLQMQKMMKQFGGAQGKGAMGRLRGMFGR